VPIVLTEEKSTADYFYQTRGVVVQEEEAKREKENVIKVERRGEI